MNKKSLDHLKFGDPSEKHISRMKMDTPLVGISFDQIRVAPPAENSSNETLSDLKSVIKAVRDSKRDGHFIELADDKPIVIFQSFANSNGLSFDEEYFKQLKKELTCLILSLKYKFNRPRPRQLANALGIELDSLSFNSANTPAYPSGHAIQSHVMANVLARMNPQFKNSLEMLADRISLSRMQAGVHYPSDILIGKEIANMIEPHVITIYERDGLALEEALDFRRVTREFLQEGPDEELPQKLRILDFDDTIANTAERVIITTDNGAGKKFISSADFAVYDLQPGESIDPEIAFVEFDSVDAERATPVPVISDMLKSFASAEGNRKLLILTARSQAVADDVMNFLETRLGIQNPSGVIDFVGVSDKNPDAKVNIIRNYLDSNPTINFVSFYDDSGKNVNAVHDFLDSRGFSRGRDQRDVRQVIKEPDGSIRLVEPDISESKDFRTISREFFKKFF